MSSKELDACLDFDDEEDRVEKKGIKTDETPSKFSGVLQALNRAKSSTPGKDVSSSKTLMVTHIPKGLCAVEKLKSHFGGRYGQVEKVEVVESRNIAFIGFQAQDVARRAFINRAPVFKDPSIRVYRICDYSDDDSRKQAEIHAEPAPNRKIVESTPVKSNGENGAGLKDKKESVGDSTEPVAAASSTLNSLYDDDDEDESGVPESATVAKTSLGPTKRTWQRAGLVNHHDADVIKAKIAKKKAQLKVDDAKAQVDQLLGDLAKQKQQLSNLSNRTVGANLKAELMNATKLLMMQLKVAKTTMENAKANVEIANKAYESALEKSKSEKDVIT